MDIICGTSGAEEKYNNNVYHHYDYLISSSHLNNTGKQDVEEKYQVFKLTVLLRLFAYLANIT